MTAGKSAAKAPRRRRRRLPAALSLLALTVIASLLAFYGSVLIDDPEHQGIRFERARRLALSAAGPLPGTPDLTQLERRLADHGVTLGAPVFLRIFKREFELELWMQREGKFVLFATYPICRWSGRLGPKVQQGDAQAPEGFYTVDSKALNPNSRWHRSFNLGFPNAYDRALKRTGSLLMVHGGCSSIGCYAMTNPVIDEIWRLITAALDRGQRRFQVQVFPFRMTDANLAGREPSPTLDFWRNLKTGYDLFETDPVPPRVSVCAGKYAFSPAGSVTDGSAAIDTTCPGNA